MRYRLFVGLLLALLLSTGLSFFSSQHVVFAATATRCSQYTCDHLAPESSMTSDGRHLCSDGGSDGVAPLFGYGWTLELRWGPYCLTNWARFGSNGGLTSCIDLMVQRATPHTEDHAYGCGPQAGIWTGQLYAPGAAQACVRFGTWPGVFYGSWNCTSWSPGT